MLCKAMEHISEQHSMPEECSRAAITSLLSTCQASTASGPAGTHKQRCPQTCRSMDFDVQQVSMCQPSYGKTHSSPRVPVGTSLRAWGLCDLGSLQFVTRVSSHAKAHTDMSRS